MPHVEALREKKMTGYTVDPAKVVIVTKKGHPLFQASRNEEPITREQIIAIAHGPPASALRLRKDDDTGESLVVAGRQRVKSALAANAIGCGVEYTGPLKSVRDAIEDGMADAEFVKRVTALMGGTPRLLPALAANGKIDGVRGMMATENAFARGESRSAVIRALQEDVKEFEIPIEVAAERRGLKLSTARKYLKADPDVKPKKPSRGKASGPGKTQIAKWFADPRLLECTVDYKVIFGFIGGKNTKDELFKAHPDLKGIV